MRFDANKPYLSGGKKKLGKSVLFNRREPDPKTGKIKRELVGTMKRFSTTLPDELVTKLTDSEKEKFQTWSTAERERREHRLQNYYLKNLPAVLANATLALQNYVEPEDSVAIWDLLNELQRALERAGHQKTQGRGRPQSKNINLKERALTWVGDRDTADPQDVDADTFHRLSPNAD